MIAYSNVNDLGSSYEPYTGTRNCDYGFDEDLLLVQIRLLHNEAMKAFLRSGLFLVLNPPKEFMGIKDMYWHKSLRCDRHGIGLRNRIDQ